ncbi:MAG: methyltransferase [Xenococcaceae cyanobacterium]
MLNRCSSIKNRLKWSGGDFFKEVPTANVMILSEVIHDWNDKLALQILRNCRTSICSSGKIYLVERFIDEEEQKNRGNLIDIVMMVVTGGKERTVKQYQELLGEAGFELLNTNFIPDSRGRILLEGIAI